MRKKDNYRPDSAPEKTFTAYIIKGNRQVIEREVTASKRFRVDAETYIIKDDCIFLKNIEGRLRSVSYYREGNPNPYNFKKTNTGITSNELDNFYAEDFYNIIVNVRPDTRARYMFMGVMVVLALNLAYLIGVCLNVFVFK